MACSKKIRSSDNGRQNSPVLCWDDKMVLLQMKTSSKKIVLWFKSLTGTKFIQGCTNLFSHLMKRLNISVKKKVAVVAEVPVEPIVEPFVLETPVAEVMEEKTAPVDPGDFVVDEDDSSLFHNLKNKDFSIRVSKDHPNGKKRDKDHLVFATSLPHQFNSFTFKAMQTYVPQLTDLDFRKSHELLVIKSAASKFEDLQSLIMRFIFIRMDRGRSQRLEEQTVVIGTCPNSDILVFNLRVQTCDHLDLGTAMFEINGIASQMVGEHFPLCMDHANRYDFNLMKAKAFSWEELLPQIKQTFNNYFPAGVKFTGYMQNQTELTEEINGRL